MDKLYPKLFSCMKKYSKEQLVKDIIAGIIVAIIALPLSIALALASGVGPEQGLYTAIVAGFIISFLGGSRVQISGPTAAFASIVAGIVATHGMQGLVVATIMAGIILILMGLLKLGSLIKFIPYTITTGFTTGIAITIVIGQLKDFFGLTFEHAPVETIEKVTETVKCFGTINISAMLVGLLALAILIIMPKFVKKVPPSLVAIIVCAAVVKIFDLNVNTIGDLYQISSALPTPSIPGFSMETVRNVIPDAFTIAVLAAIESLLSCVVADGMIGSSHNSNMELVAQGVGNIGSALFGGIPATGAIARTAANIKNGGRTPIAGMVHAIVLLIVLVVLMPYASLIPMPAIAAILFIVAYNMSEWREFVSVVKSAPKSDVTVLIVTFALTVVFDLVVAICVGFVLATVMFMKRMADVTNVSGWEYIDANTDADNIRLKEVPKNTLVYEITGPMFFGAADKIAAVIREAKRGAVILRMRSVPAVDATGLHSLQTIVKACKKKNIVLVMSHVNEQPMKIFKKSGMYEAIGEENFCENIDVALERAKAITEG
ncbi:MAG: sulfate permease [Clostridia bacterium]|nr:sulfate permease [Clostridia bacterium]